MDLITNTFVVVAADCPVSEGVIPPSRGGRPTVAGIQYGLLTQRPYALTLEDLMFATHAARSDLSPDEAEARGEEICAQLFTRPYPCMRASDLPKRFGWGVHHDRQGRISLFSAASEEYGRYARGEEAGVAIVAAMRSRRAPRTDP
jgi:hypothetical protein